MITKLTHVGIHVINQDSAYDFYVNKLGFKVITDVPMGKDTRWLTVSPPEQPGFEIVLTPIVESKQFPKETIEVVKDLVRNGTFGFGVFTCEDIYATYEELKAKGVEFIKAPKQEFYGLEALFKDDSGNWASLAQLEK
ncbi:VOC family protein [Chitinophaga sp. RAB17]|uniref:VOC family protein n=1 Tax=Chitinophaga sp. RAB17 TaxID=3233049 RepID=UPI003F8E73F2